MRILRRSMFGVVTILVGASFVAACDFLTGDLDAFLASTRDSAVVEETSEEPRDVVVEEGSDTSPPIDASTDEASAPQRCPSKGGAMVVVPLPLDAGTYCVDTTEVTNRAYQEFLDVIKVTPPTQSTKCTWNQSFLPDLINASCPSVVFDPVGRANIPVVCIDWCDATAFCAWAGKRLCGGLGADAGPAIYLGPPASSQWRWACSKGGSRDYPYGDAYAPQACNGVENDAGNKELLDAGSVPGCVGGFPGLRDMSGNAWEWIDACENNTSVDAGTICQVVGGSFGELSGQLTCDSSGMWSRRFTESNIGFRCCAD